jgi:hypothetical protein
LYFQLLDLCYPGCIIVHLPLTIVGVYVGGVEGKVHVKPVSILPVRVLPLIPSHSLANSSCCASLKPLDDAVHVPSVGVAICPPTIEGLHVAVGGGGGASVTVVLPSGHVSATAQDLGRKVSIQNGLLISITSVIGITGW